MPDYFWPIVTGVLVVALFFGGILPRIRTEKAKSVIDLQAAEIAAYETAIAAQDKRFGDRINEMERRHQREIGELRGRIDAMTPEFAASLAKEITPTLIAAVVPLLEKRSA